MPNFRDVCAEAEAALIEIKDSVSLMTTRKELFANASLVFQFANRSVHAKKTMDDFFGTRTIAPDTIHRGLFVQIGAIFELFIRKSIEFVVEVHSERSPNFDALPHRIKNSNYYFSGRALSTVHEGIGGRKINYEEISRKLATCTPRNKHFELNTDCFTLFLGNCTSNNIKKVMASVNVRGDFWQEMGKQQALRDHFNSKATSETKKLAEGKLNDYITTRNGIIHRGEHFKTVTEQEVVEHCDFFCALMTAISDYLSSEPF